MRRMRRMKRRGKASGPAGIQAVSHSGRQAFGHPDSQALPTAVMARSERPEVTSPNPMSPMSKHLAHRTRSRKRRGHPPGQDTRHYTLLFILILIHPAPWSGHPSLLGILILIHSTSLSTPPPGQGTRDGLSPFTLIVILVLIHHAACFSSTREAGGSSSFSSYQRSGSCISTETMFGSIAGRRNCGAQSSSVRARRQSSS